MAKSDDAATPPAGKGKLKLILLIVLGLLLAIGASIGGTWYIMHSSASKPAPAAETASNVKQPAIFEPMLPAFVANFNQNGRQRYLQVSITLLARRVSRRCTSVTLRANRVRKVASSSAVSPPPTTTMSWSRKKKPSQVAHHETPRPDSRSSPGTPSVRYADPIASTTVRAR